MLQPADCCLCWQAQAGGSDAINEYLSLKTVLDGLAMVLETTTGVKLQSEQLQPGEGSCLQPGAQQQGAVSQACIMCTGEGWAPGVQKLALQHPDEGLMGHIYLDCHPR